MIERLHVSFLVCVHNTSQLGRRYSEFQSSPTLFRYMVAHGRQGQPAEDPSGVTRNVQGTCCALQGVAGSQARAHDCGKHCYRSLRLGTAVVRSNSVQLQVTTCVFRRNMVKFLSCSRIPLPIFCGSSYAYFFPAARPSEGLGLLNIRAISGQPQADLRFEKWSK
jgi:hypothetical protein